jgi:serine/threonine protein kinase
MVDDLASTKSLKLADWGFSTFVKPGKPLTSLCGTCYYIAPVWFGGTRGGGCG